MAGAQRTLTRDLLRSHLQANAFRPGRADLVGAEVELTPLAIVDGKADPRAGQDATDGLWADLAGSSLSATITWRGGSLSREPGGQLEFSGPPFQTPEDSATATTAAVEGLRSLARRRRFELLAIGLHPWASPRAIGLHRATPRYRAMQRYFDAINMQGRRMMRQTGSVHLAIDFGAGAEFRERWELAQRLAPVLAAVFGNSSVWGGRPGFAVASLRGFAWGRLDRGRTGVPAGFLQDPDSDPIEQYLDFALAAPVMFVVHPDGSHEVPDRHPAFADWMNNRLPQGYPDLDDWQTHLGTLFPNVRPQGYLEIRTIDAPGAAWVGVPILLAAHALRSPRVRRDLLETLRPHHETLIVGSFAETRGLSDPILRDLAEELFRSVRPLLRGASEALVASFHERYTQQGRTPGAELSGRILKGRRLDPTDLLRLERERASSIRVEAPTPAIG